VKVIRHDTVLVHDITGAPRNLLEQVSVPRGRRPSGKGWRYLHGWRSKTDGQAYDVYTRERPLPAGVDR
jgi:hypothetical protein